MADVKFRTFTFETTTDVAGTTADYTISGLGWTPKGAIFSWSGASALDTTEASFAAGYGFSDGVNNVCSSVYSKDNDVIKSYLAFRGDRCINMLKDPKNHLCEFSVDSFIVDGLRLYTNIASATTHQITCVLVGGSDVDFAACGTKDDLAATAGATIPITGLPGKPNLVFTVDGYLPSTGHSNNSYINFGAAFDAVPIQNRSLYYKSQHDAATSDLDIFVSNTDIRPGYNVSTFDANGFTISSDNNSANHLLGYLALKIDNAPNIKLVNATVPSSGDLALNGAGFEPGFGLFVLANGISIYDLMVVDTDIAVSFLAFDDINISTQTFAARDNVSPAIAKSFSDNSFKLLGADGATVSTEGTFEGFNSDGADFALTTNPPSDFVGWGLFVEGSAEANINIEVNLHSLTLTSFSSTIDFQPGVIIDVATGSFELTAISPDMRVDFRYWAALEYSNITGYSSNVDLETDIPANIQFIQITPFTSDQSLNTPVNAGLQSSILTSNQASLALDINFDAQLGFIQFSEFNSGIDSSFSINVAPYYLQIGGLNTSINSDISINANSELLQIIDLNADINSGVLIDVDNGYLSLGALNSSIVSDSEIEVLTGMLALQSFQVQIDDSILISSEWQQIGFSGNNTYLEQDANVDAEIELLTLVSYNAQIYSGGAVIPITVPGLQYTIPG